MPRPAPLLDYSHYSSISDTFWTNYTQKVWPAGHLYEDFTSQRRCPYCQTRTVLIVDGYQGNLADFAYVPFEERFLQIWGCTSCGWWYEDFTLFKHEGGGLEKIRRKVPILREFNVDSDELPLETLGAEILARPHVLHHIHPKRLEVLVAAVVSDHFEVEVSVVGRSGDGGIDLVYVNGDRPFAIQVKRRESPDGKEGISLIREFLGACILSGHRNAMIFTTATGFTRGATKAATLACDMKLVDTYNLTSRDEFIRLFRYTPLASRYPWTTHVNDWLKLWGDDPESEFKLKRRYIK